MVAFTTVSCPKVLSLRWHISLIINYHYYYLNSASKAAKQHISVQSSYSLVVLFLWHEHPNDALAAYRWRWLDECCISHFGSPPSNCKRGRKMVIFQAISFLFPSPGENKKTTTRICTTADKISRQGLTFHSFLLIFIFSSTGSLKMIEKWNSCREEIRKKASLKVPFSFSFSRDKNWLESKVNSSHKLTDWIEFI